MHTYSSFEPQLHRVSDFIQENFVLAVEGRKCVDGRYLPYQAKGTIARPGGDGGYVMALMAVSRKKKLGLTPEACFNAVYKKVATGNGHFSMHTDNIVDPDGRARHGLIGCGHFSSAASKSLSKEYDVLSKDMERLVEYIRNIADITPALEMVNLVGDHKELGVLVIESRSYTVSSQSLNGEMYFIYDEERDTEFLKNLVNELSIPGVTYSDMKLESDIQLRATLHSLAKGLPVYAVRFLPKNPQVHFSYFVS